MTTEQLDSTSTDGGAPAPSTTGIGTGGKVAIAAAALLVVTGLVAGGLLWQANRNNHKATAGNARDFGPDGFAKLTIGMTKQQALASGDLGTGPISLSGSCETYSFKGGPKPDPTLIAAEAQAEKEYEAAELKAKELEAKAAAPLSPHASAAESAKYAQLQADAAGASATVAEASAKSAELSAKRTEAFVAAGGVSFGDGKLRMILAPPGVHTPEGIAVGSPVAKVTAAYAKNGLKEDDGRHSMPLSKHPGWQYSFDVDGGKVTAMLLWNSNIHCSKA